MKRIRMIIIVGFIGILSVTSVFAATKATVYLNLGNSSVESSNVGSGKKGKFEASTYADSPSAAYMSSYCAWTGYPFTMERRLLVPIGKTIIHTEYQSEKSNYYIRLTCAIDKRTHAKGTVTAFD